MTKEDWAMLGGIGLFILFFLAIIHSSMSASAKCDAKLKELGFKRLDMYRSGQCIAILPDGGLKLIE